MATKWQKNKVNENSINDGYEYERKDRPSRQQLNAIVNNSFYASNIAENVSQQLSNLDPNEKIEFKGSNPNLLINGDFRVNQRGQTDYRANEYTVDRWDKRSVNCVVTPISTGIKIVDNIGDSKYRPLQQKIEQDFTKYAGKQITLSAFIRNVTSNTVLSLSVMFFSDDNYASRLLTSSDSYYFYLKQGFLSTTVTIPDGAKTCVVYFYKETLETYECEIDYIKLEFGSVATPFIPRPYAEELALCQRYYYKIDPNALYLARGNSGTIFTATIITPVAIRNTHSIEDYAGATFTAYGDGSNITGNISRVQSWGTTQDSNSISIVTETDVSTLGYAKLYSVKFTAFGIDAEIY